MALNLAYSGTVARNDIGGDPYAIACVEGGAHKMKKLWLNPDGHGRNSVALPPDSHFTLEPPHDGSQRQCLWVFGMSGSGKSTILRSYARRYRMIWPRRPIVLISQLNADETLDLLAEEIGMRRLSLHSLIERPLALEELGSNGSLIMFDDIDALDTATDTAVFDAIKKIATMGRHARCSMLVASHASTSGLKTRVILNEMHGFVCFNHGASNRAINYLLENYASCSKEQCKAARKIRSRWFYVSKTYPGYIVSDGLAYLLHGADDDSDTDVRPVKRQKTKTVRFEPLLQDDDDYVE